MEKLRELTTIVIVSLLVFFCLLYIAVEVLNQRQTAASPGVNYFRIDSSFAPDRLEKIKDAIGKWEAASGGCLKIPYRIADVPMSDIFNWAEDGIPTIYNASGLLSWKRYLASQMCGTTCLGVTHRYAGDIFILENSDRLFETVVLHEIGHLVLGGGHSNDKNDLMYPTIDGTPRGISPGEEVRTKLLHCEHGEE